MNNDSARMQFLRYAAVGQASNAILYGAYLGLTWLGVEPKTSMTLMYFLGIVQTFVFNKRWSFRHRGERGPAFVRYCAVYAVGYIINFLSLLILVDHFNYPHQLVQGAMIIIIAAILFLAQRYWVFPHASGVDFQ